MRIERKFHYAEADSRIPTMGGYRVYEKSEVEIGKSNKEIKYENICFYGSCTSVATNINHLECGGLDDNYKPKLFIKDLKVCDFHDRTSPHYYTNLKDLEDYFFNGEYLLENHIGTLENFLHG